MRPSRWLSNGGWQWVEQKISEFSNFLFTCCCCCCFFCFYFLFLFVAYFSILCSVRFSVLFSNSKGNYFHFYVYFDLLILYSNEGFVECFTWLRLPSWNIENGNVRVFKKPRKQKKKKNRKNEKRKGKREKWLAFVYKYKSLSYIESKNLTHIQTF